MPNTLDLSHDLKELMNLAGREEGTDDLLRRGVDWLARLVPYDLATVFLLEDGRLQAKVARGPLAGPRVREHSLDLAKFPSVRETLETRRARAFNEEDHAHGEGDPFDGVLDLPHGHSCMVVPLCAGDRCLGILTLDRSECVAYDPAVVTLCEVYGQILAMALRLAEQKLALERLHEQDHEHAKLLEAQLAGDVTGVLEGSRSPVMRDVLARARQVASADTPVLVLGETGTGKERLARGIHLWSPRRDQPFVAVNSAAIPRDLLESELFGHVKGAFTGATKDRAGRFQLANGGTLLLDEIGELDPAFQAKLLRVLQEGTFEPLGGERTVKVDVRVIAATHVDLEAAVAAGRFREDLYYRLAVFPLQLPPLRERLEDLPALAEALLAEQAARSGRRVTLGPAALERLAAYPWPGNVRELANVLERAAILAGGGALDAARIDQALGRAGGRSATRRRPPEAPAAEGPLVTLDEAQRQHIARALERTGGKLYGPDGAAALLGLKPTTLQSRMKKLGVARPEA